MIQSKYYQMVRNIAILMRPHQWLKNVFVFAPLFFGHQLTNLASLGYSVLAFFAFCFAASAVYCFNDIYDLKADLKHPEKSKRPIASGAVTKTQGYIISVVCILVSLIFSWLLSDDSQEGMVFIITFYLLMNLAYCIRLKSVAIVDVVIIAIGFVLRIFAGSVATGIVLSHWLIMMTFLLALFLAFAKRRDDVVLYEEAGVKARKNVNRYNLEFMNQAISILAAVLIICYVMYTVSESVIFRLQNNYLYMTSVFVVLGIFRYLQITIVDVKSGDPSKVLLKDRFLQLTLAGWILSFCFVLYY